MSKLGGAGRFTLIGATAWPCAETICGLKRPRASVTNREVPNPNRTMSLLLSPRVGGPFRRATQRPEALVNRVDALNNIAVRRRQAPIIVGLAAALVFAAMGCNRNKPGARARRPDAAVVEPLHAPLPTAE